jgi:hypothetical protein
MRASIALKLMMIAATVALAGCGVVEAQRQAEEQRQQQFVQRVDLAHIFVTTGTPPSGKPYTVLGELNYTEPFSPDAIDEEKIKDRLKKMAYEKWPDTIDAVVDENQQVSSDGAQVTVTAKAIQYESSVDRTALHKMNEGLVVSPTNQ